MSHDPKIGGKLREETFRSRQVTGWMNPCLDGAPCLNSR
jgi:hypothetical protein